MALSFRLISLNAKVIKRLTHSDTMATLAFNELRIYSKNAEN